MTANDLKLYQSTASPNSRRVRIFLAEKGLTVTSVPVVTTLPFIAGDHFSAVDITGLVTVDFATKAIGLPMPKEHKAVQRWFEKVSSRPTAGACGR
jgi:glutathione S-transferase